MINSSRALVFAMLSTASGWGLPSHDSLLSPNESGVDGPRDRRKLGSGSSCDICDAYTLTSCDGSCDSDSGCNSGCTCDKKCDASCDNSFWGGGCDDSCKEGCDSTCNTGCDSGGVPTSCDSGCDTCVDVSCPVDYAGTPAPSSRCNSDGQLFWEGLWGGTWGNRNPVYSGCYKLGSCDESCDFFNVKSSCDSNCNGLIF